MPSEGLNIDFPTQWVVAIETEQVKRESRYAHMCCESIRTDTGLAVEKVWSFYYEWQHWGV